MLMTAYHFHTELEENNSVVCIEAYCGLLPWTVRDLVTTEMVDVKHNCNQLRLQESSFSVIS